MTLKATSQKKKWNKITEKFIVVVCISVKPYKCMKNENVTATTVKIGHEVYCDFKGLASRRRMTFQTFVDRCVHLYIKNEPFRDMVNAFTLAPQLSTTGSFGV